MLMVQCRRCFLVACPFYTVHRRTLSPRSTVRSRLQVSVEATVIIILGSYLLQARKQNLPL